MSQQIGKYRIIERIGRGGMGTVYKAHDPVLDRLVALKVISSDAEVSEELRARFYREAQACARLSHPNIVVVHDLGEDAGQLFIVMEFLDGRELSHLIEQKALTLEDKLAVMVQVCDGLHFAHQKGIIHRDIKPGNIFFLKNGQAKILDFGIARIAAGTDPGLTRTGLIMGTLRYMSPEQARGKVDHRSDIFSVGAVFYELLGGRPVFDSPDPFEMLEKIRVEQPTPLPELDPGIPSELAALVERALRKDPGQRFPDLGQMRAQLEAFRRGFTDAEERLEAQVRGQVDRLGELQRAIARYLGQSPEDETIRVATERTGLPELRALARELRARLDGLQTRLSRLEALEPAVSRGLDLLRAGEAPAAAAALEPVVREVPEHARARNALEQARQAALRPAAPVSTSPVSTAPAPATPVDAIRSPAPGPAARPAGAAPAVGARPSARRHGLAVAVVAAMLVAGAAGYLLYPSHRPPLSPPAPPSAPAGPAPAAAAPATVSSGPAPAAPGGVPPPERTAPPPAPSPASAARPAPAERAAVEVVRKGTRAARAAATKVQAERLAPVLWAPAMASEREGDAALGRRDFAGAHAAYREAQQAYERAAAEAQRAVVLVAREFEARRVQERATEARRAAEQVDAAKAVPPLWSRAAGAEQEAEAALRRQEFERAQALWGEAARTYREAAQRAAERPRIAALPTPPAPSAPAPTIAPAAVPAPVPAPDDSRARAEAERLRAAVTSGREQALRSGADRLAREVFEGARGKEGEAASLEAEQQFAAASQAYQDAAQRYGEAMSRARVARVAQSEADQARGRMLADKQKARTDARDFRAGVEEEQLGDAKYEGAAFKEAAAHFRVARGLFVRAAGPASDARPAAGDPRTEIRSVLDRYKQATEARDAPRLRQIRPGLTPAEARRIDRVQSHQLDLTVDTIEVNGDEAQAKGRRTDVVVTKDGRTFRNEGAVVFRLRRLPSGWIIEAVD